MSDSTVCLENLENGTSKRFSDWSSHLQIGQIGRLDGTNYIGLAASQFHKQYSCSLLCPEKSLLRRAMYVFRAFYQSAQFINWPAQSRNYRLGAQFINRVRNLEIESRASNERSVHVLFIP